MKIGFDEILEYARCPIIYLIRRVYGIEEENLKDEFSEAVKKTIQHFYFQLMSNKVLDFESLLRKWDSIWFKGVDANDIIYGQEPEKAKLGRDGAGMISGFYDDNAHAPGIPLAVAYDYEVPVAGHVITGTIDLVREVEENRKRTVEIVYFSTSGYKPVDWEIRNNLHTTMQAYAFRKEFQVKEQRLSYYSLKQRERFEAYRTDDQISRLESFVDIICTSIESNFFYPRPTVLCKYCSVKNFCEQWGVK